MSSNEDSAPAEPGGTAAALPGTGTDAALAAGRYRFADVEFDEAEGGLRVGNKPVVVEPRPLRLLAELLRHVGEVVTKEELLDTVWEGRPTVDHVLANAVSKLRTALGEQGAARLLTVPRVGYRLVGPVQRLEARPAEAQLLAGQPVPGRESFVLERVLGQGGNSDVWLARHAKLGQTHVFKFASDGARLSALKREYTLYRVLRQELVPRADFAVVLDSNFSSAPYFLECEYGGLSLLEWAAEDGRLDAMAPGDRLALFLQIARAVAAAHSVGVLHKDLKPGNVLVEGPALACQARLTDFGSGRLLEAGRLAGLQLTAQGLTQTQDHATPDSRSGTPMYQAPEVLAGQTPSMQSDVYALGLMLYQLLAGDLRRPLATGWEREIDDELLREDIRAATEGRTAVRLRSVAELVDRIAALPGRRAERAARLEAEQRGADTRAQAARARARRPWLIAAFGTLLVGLVAASLLALHAQRSLEEARQATARANSLNEFMADGLLSGLVVERLDEKANVSMTETLQRASERAAQRFAAFPQTEAELRLNLAQSYYRLSHLAEATQELRRAVALVSPLALPPADNPKALGLLRRLQLHLANALVDQDQIQAARELLKVVETGPPGEPDNPAAVARMLAQVRFNLAYKQQDYAQALKLSGPMIGLTEALPPDRLAERFGAYMLLGDTQYFLGRFAESVQTYSRLLQPPFGPEAVGAVLQARAQVNLSRAQVGAGQLDGVEQRLLAARATLRKLGTAKELHLGVASAELGNLYEQQNRFAEAEAAYRDALQAFTAAVGEGHTSSRITRLNLAIMESNNGHAQAALEKLEAGRGWFVSNQGGASGPVVQAIDFERARALGTLQRGQEALALLDGLKADTLAQATPSRDWPWRLQAERGRALLSAGRAAEGQALLQQALPGLQANGSAPWVLAAYRQAAQGRTSAP